MATSCLAGSLVKTFDIVSSNVCYKWPHVPQEKALLAGRQFNAFSGKCFVQYKLVLIIFYRLKHNELLGIHRRIIHVCAKKQSALKPRDAIDEKEKEPAFMVVS